MFYKVSLISVLWCNWKQAFEMWLLDPSFLQNVNVTVKEGNESKSWKSWGKKKRLVSALSSEVLGLSVGLPPLK